MPVATAVKQKVTITLPEPLYDAYAERAGKRGKPVEAEIVERLTIAKDYTATLPLYVDDPARNALSQIAGRSIRTVEDLLDWARRVSVMSVNGTQIELSERLLSRLDGRRFGRTMPEMLSQTVTECLEREVGMR